MDTDTDGYISGVVISRNCSCLDFATSHTPTSIIMADGCDLCIDGTYLVFSTSYNISYKIKRVH